MAQIIFHMKPSFDVTRAEVEFEMSEDYSDLSSQLSRRNVDRVEFNTDED